MKLLFSLIAVFGLCEGAFAVSLRSAYAPNLCLDVNRNPNAGWRFERNVEVWECNRNDNQQFGLQPFAVKDGQTSFTVQVLGKCLDIDLGFQESWTHGNNVQAFACNGDVNQQFRLEPQANGWFMIRSVMDGRCLDIDLNKANGWRYEHNVQLWNCSGESNQLWKFDATDGNGGVILQPGFTLSTP